MLTVHPKSNPRRIQRWSACEAFTWAAFGEARPFQDHFEYPCKEWSLDWKVWPPQWLNEILTEMDTGVPWTPHPDDCSPWEADNVRAQARRIIADTDMDARQLAAVLATDVERWKRITERLREAWREVMRAVREGRLTVWACPALPKNHPKRGAVHKVLDPLLFEGLRAISVFSKVDEFRPPRTAFDVRAENDFNFLEYAGPWFDAVLFDAAEVRREWPNTARKPPPKARKAIAPSALDAALRTYCGTLPNGRVKQPDAERHLRDAMGCSRDTARAAYARLPAICKLKQGKPAVPKPATDLSNGDMQV